MKAKQLLALFIGVFVLLTLGLSVTVVQTTPILAQPLQTTEIAEPPAKLAEFPIESSPFSTLPVHLNGTNLAYLPFVITPACSPNPQEAAIAQLAATNPGQRRPSFTCNKILADVARARATDMALRGYFSHINPDGFGPNYLVEQAGYQLPLGWTNPVTLNYIESIAGGFPTAELAWNAWINSPGHRAHVLGEDPFWAAQTNYGIGYVFIEGSPFRHYWVFISAPPSP